MGFNLNYNGFRIISKILILVFILMFIIVNFSHWERRLLQGKLYSKVIHCVQFAKSRLLWY